mgnify:CR=1 FL=1
MTFEEFRKYFNKKYPNDSKRGYKFEDYAKWFLENSPQYKKIFKNVYKDKEYPRKWLPAGLGIDIYAEGYDNEVYTIQVKYYNPKAKLPYDEVSKF